MVCTILSLFLAFVFFVLGGFHVYWLFGGVWAVERVIPTKAGGEDLPAIPRTATLIVGLVLILFAWMYLMKSGLVPVQVPKGIMNYGYWFIPSIFILRAVGDFNYVGFFKKIKHTAFAKADSKVFIPLCLAIGIMGILIQLMD